MLQDKYSLEPNDQFQSLADLISALNSTSIANSDIDLLGPEYEASILTEERYHYGQYFTPPEVIDLILGFCLQKDTKLILDPSCGTGSFLVRTNAWMRTSTTDQQMSLTLDSLWGIDLASLPALLSRINLGIRFPKDKTELVSQHILQRDFFQISPESDFTEMIPALFDAIIGNPPYTREIELAQDPDAKKDLVSNALFNHEESLAKLTLRVGLYAYFFVHAFKFLREGGFLGFVVPILGWIQITGKVYKNFS